MRRAKVGRRDGASGDGRSGRLHLAQVPPRACVGVTRTSQRPRPLLTSPSIARPPARPPAGSWSDDGREKHEALQGWAEAFEASNGRSPIVWLDRCCIRQDEDIAASLLGLPVYLSGCRSLLVLYGASYCGRLWCVMEVFCFLAMGGTLDAIQVLLLPSSSAARAGSSYASVGEPGKGKGAAWTLRRGLAKFRLSEATCTVPGDRTRMLAVIECAFGDDVPFNRIVRSLLSGLSHRHASCTSRGTTFRSISRGGHGGSLVSVAEPSGPSGRASADAEGVACKV